MLFDYVAITTPHWLYPQSKYRIKRVIAQSWRSAGALPAALNFVRVAFGEVCRKFVNEMLDRLDYVLLNPMAEVLRRLRTCSHQQRASPRVVEVQMAALFRRDAECPTMKSLTADSEFR
jgi:hypothetical protein